MQTISLRNVGVVLALGVVGAVLAFVVPASLLPTITSAVVLAGAAMSLNMLIGNTGLISIGHGLFVGVGAYAVAMGSIRYGLNIWAGFLIAVIGSIVVGIVVAGIALRAKLLFFALLTLALGEVAFVFVARSYRLTGGDDGLAGVVVPGWLGTDVSQHLFSVGVSIIIVLVLLFVLASPFGATLRAIRDNRDRVSSLGINPKMYEFAAFVGAGVLGAMSGTLIAITERGVTPELFSWLTGAILLVGVALGGRFTFFGPIVGIAILEITRGFVQARSVYADFAVGSLVILAAVAFPEGLVAAARGFTKGSRHPTPHIEDDEMRATPAEVRE